MDGEIILCKDTIARAVVDGGLANTYSGDFCTVIYVESTDTITKFRPLMRRCSGSKSHVVPKSVAPVWAFRPPLLHQKGSSYSVVTGLKETLPTHIAIVAKQIIRERIRRVFPPSLGTVEQIYRHQLALTSRSPFRLS